VGDQNLKVAEARFREARAMIRFNRASEFPTISANPSVASLRDSQNQSYFAIRTSATGQFVLPFDLSYEGDLWGRDCRHSCWSAVPISPLRKGASRK
jgi:outer membrane protein TolC